MAKIISIDQQKRIDAFAKATKRPFSHTFEVPGTAVVKSFKPKLGVKATGQAMPNKEPKIKLQKAVAVKSEPIQKRSRNLRNRAAKVDK